MALSIEQTAANLGIALALGAAIGFERQWRQRLAGLRTHTLVSLGARPSWCSAAVGGRAGAGAWVQAAICRGEQEAHVRALMLQGLSVGRLSLEPTVSAARQRMSVVVRDGDHLRRRDAIRPGHVVRASRCFGCRGVLGALNRGA